MVLHTFNSVVDLEHCPESRKSSLLFRTYTRGQMDKTEINDRAQSLRRCHTELYKMLMERETLEVVELRRARRERDRCNRHTETPEQAELQDGKVTGTGEITYLQNNIN